MDPAADLHRYCGLEPAVVFDVGAWTGTTVAAWRRAWPGAAVYAFEPVPESFAALTTRFAGDPCVRAAPIALGRADGTGTLRRADDPSMHAVDTTGGGGADVAVRSLDSWCAEHGIGTVDYLKVDTEGGDLAVLEGAEGMLASRAVRVVQVEAGMNPTTDVQVPFADLRAVLNRHGYLLFGVYEQVHEWRLRQPQLRRADCVFVAPDVPLGGPAARA